MQETHFLADAMLGRLARWLRAINADTLQLPIDSHDSDLVARAAAEGRVLLTRDRRLQRELRPARSFAVTSSVPLEQLVQVVRAFDLRRPPEFLTRCLLCNVSLDVVQPTDARQLIPPKSRDLPGTVRRCPSCGRVYWRGSHVRRMEAALAAALPDWK
ncbi:MAG TPA: Mut7-C RNAse domain-containing protein [Gemmatimonadaceae bacterium]|nr:Mut7-C RNAse domain-containing protein [Gemmatimonadaceae bacterium]